MQSLPFAQPGRFFRGNLHTHSTRSDGRLSPDDVMRTYRDAGYDFLSLTDHFLDRYGFPITDTTGFRTAGFTTLLGAELHGPRTEVGERWHLVAVGLPLDFAPAGADETGPALAARASEAGAFVGIAHPAWYNLTLADALTIESADAVEVYNETCAQESDRGDSWHLADMMLARGRRLSTYAADDAHFGGRADSLAAWVQVKAADLTPAALLAALKAGHYYSSQGPTIESIEVDNGTLRVATSPARLIVVSGRAAASRVVRGPAVMEAALSVEPFAGSYCRVTVIDESGRRAWSNPIWLA
ncbi:MAG: CehA/McbA family metallohydrolase [Chloroflexi bacterium]|nr:CehA/McbA family metallohydrolase [Chloroflexota bacterium]